MLFSDSGEANTVSQSCLAGLPWRVYHRHLSLLFMFCLSRRAGEPNLSSVRDKQHTAGRHQPIAGREPTHQISDEESLSTSHQTNGPEVTKSTRSETPEPRGLETRPLLPLGVKAAMYVDFPIRRTTWGEWPSPGCLSIMACSSPSCPNQTQGRRDFTVRQVSLKTIHEKTAPPCPTPTDPTGFGHLPGALITLIVPDHCSSQQTISRRRKQKMASRDLPSLHCVRSSALLCTQEQGDNQSLSHSSLTGSVTFATFKSRLRLYTPFVPLFAVHCLNPHPAIRNASRSHNAHAARQPCRSLFSRIPHLPLYMMSPSTRRTGGDLDPSQYPLTSISSPAEGNYTSSFSQSLSPNMGLFLVCPGASILSRNSGGIVGMYLRSLSRLTPPKPAP